MKVAISPDAAAALVPDGASLMIGGFAVVGTPQRMIEALVRAGRCRLTVIAVDGGRDNLGIGRLVHEGCVERVVASHIGLNAELQQAMVAGRIAVELVPQGTLVERIRAAGCGLGGVLTKTGLGTLAAEGQQVVEVGGEPWLCLPPLAADFALICADQADHLGNLTYQLTATNFNPVMAMAGKVVICEPREIVPVGMIPPDAVKTPGVLVTHLLTRAT